MPLPTNISLLRAQQSVKEGVLLDFPFDNEKWPLAMRAGHGVPAFVRIGSGTYTSKDGLVKKANTNCLRHSEEFGDAYWGKNCLNCVTHVADAPDGTKTATKVHETTADSVHEIYSGENFTAEPWTFSVYAKAAERDWIRVIFDPSAANGVYFNLRDGVVGTASAGRTGAIEAIGNGWYRCSVTATASTALWYCDVRICLNGSTEYYVGDSGKGVYVWGAQAELGPSATLYARTIAVNSGALRIDHDSEGNCLGALMEGQRTNLLLDSGDLGSGNWSNWESGTGEYPTVTANCAVAPDGTLTATRLQFDRGAGTGNSQRLQAYYGGLSDPHASSVSIWLKTTDGSTRTIGFNDGYGSPRTVVVTGTWRRFTQSYPAVASVYSQLRVHLDETMGGANTADILAWGGQLEIAASPSSYIPTTGAAATRAYDSLTLLVDGNFNQRSGSVAFRGDSLNQQYPYFVSIGTGGYHLMQRYLDQYHAFAGMNTALPWDDEDTAPHRFVMGWESSTIRVSMDGSEIRSANQTEFRPVVGSYMKLGGIDGSDPTMIYGHIRDVKIWDHALTDDEMQYVTEWSLDDGLALEAPFNDPVSPLALRKGVGSLSFTRATAATYLGSVSGLIKTADPGQLRIEGYDMVTRRNLFMYSEKFDNAAWTKESAVTVTPNDAAAPNGTASADKVTYAASGNQYLHQFGTALRGGSGVGPAGFLANRTFTFSIWAKMASGSNTTVYISVGGESSGYGNLQLTLTSSWQRFSYTHTFGAGSVDQYLYALWMGNYNCAYHVWGAQLEEGSLTDYINSGSGGSGDRYGRFEGALIEGQGTNLALNSENMAAWGGPYESDSIVAPDGALTADKCIEATATPWFAKSANVGSNSNYYCCSMFVKKGTANIIRLWLAYYSGGTGININIDVNMNTFAMTVANGSPTAYGAIPYPNGWVRVWMAGQNPNDGSTLLQWAVNADQQDTQKYTYLWGGQVELGKFPSSYIPTTSAAVTRNEDLLTVPISGNYSDVAGAIALDWDVYAWGAGSYPAVLGNDASAMIGLNASLTQMYSNDSTNNNIYGVVSLAGRATKSALRWGGGMSSMIDAGTPLQSAAYDGAWGVASSLRLGINGYSNAKLFGHLRNLRIWNRSLSDNSMIRLTQ